MIFGPPIKYNVMTGGHTAMGGGDRKCLLLWTSFVLDICTVQSLTDYNQNMVMTGILLCIISLSEAPFNKLQKCVCVGGGRSGAGGLWVGGQGGEACVILS